MDDKMKMYLGIGGIVFLVIIIFIFLNRENFAPVKNVNCQVSEWSEWSKCKNGQKTRTRTVIQNPSGKGTPCPSLEETSTCK